MSPPPLTASVPDPPFALTDVRLGPHPAEPTSTLVVDRHGVLRHAGPSTDQQSDSPRVSGDGARVVPGFVDPHVHVRGSASARASVDISGLTTLQQILDAVRDAPDGSPWVSLWGLQPEILSDRAPTAEELEDASKGRPVRVRHRSSHAWVFSTSALDQFGIGTGSAPSGVHVERRDDGTLTGFVVDHVGWVGQRVGRVTDPERLAAEVGAWSRSLAAEGVVAIIDATATNGRRELEQLARWQAMGLIVQTLGAMSTPGVDSAPAPVRFAGHKLMPPFPAELRSLLVESWSKQIPVAVHCVEPDELGTLIETVESVPAARRGRLRIEHASTCPPQWLERIGELKATVVTHPGFVYAHGDRYLADPGLAPHEWLYRLSSWREAGAPLAFASDAPAGPTAPLLQIRSAMERRTASGRALGPAEALSEDAALECLTSAAATASGIGDDGLGRLQVGARLNAVVIEPGPAGLSDPRATVLATIIDGQVVRP